MPLHRKLLRKTSSLLRLRMAWRKTPPRTPDCSVSRKFLSSPPPPNSCSGKIPRRHQTRRLQPFQRPRRILPRLTNATKYRTSTPAANRAARPLAQTAPAATNGPMLPIQRSCNNPSCPLRFPPPLRSAAIHLSSNLALTQQQLQTLNQALAALGLSAQDIQQVDRIATVINDFNPSAFTALAYQLEELAQQAPLRRPNSYGSERSACGFQCRRCGDDPTVRKARRPQIQRATNTPATTGTAQMAEGFKSRSWSSSFRGESPGDGSSQRECKQCRRRPSKRDGNSGASTSFLYSAFNLQVKEVNLTLVNGKVGRARIQAPLPNAAANGAANTVATVPQNAKAANA